MTILMWYYIVLIMQLFFIVGLPEVITTDQGTEFRNNLLTVSFGIKHRLTTAYLTALMRDIIRHWQIQYQNLPNRSVGVGTKSFKKLFMRIIVPCKILTV